MEIFQNYKFNSLMINSFRPSEQMVEVGKNESLKYHYTSPEAFLSILKNKCVYFTDIRYLNDKKEDVYLIELIRNYITKHSDRFPNVYSAFDYLLGDSESGEITSLSEVKYKYEKVRKFVFCTCTEYDSLSMWNYYVNNGNYQGYNIGFNIEKFLNTFDTTEPRTADPFVVLYGQVLYEEKEQYKEIDKILQTIEIECLSQDFNFARVNLLIYIDRYSPFFKHPKFAHENEYRIVIEIDERYLKNNGLEKCFGENNRKIKYDFRLKNGVIVPFLNVSFNDDAISRITVSPITEFEIAKDGIRELLRVHDFMGIKIYQSNIPIRF